MEQEKIIFEKDDFLIPEPPEGWWKLDEKDRNEIYDYIHDIGEKYNGFMDAYRERMQEIVIHVRMFCLIVFLLFAAIIFCLLY